MPKGAGTIYSRDRDNGSFVGNDSKLLQWKIDGGGTVSLELYKDTDTSISKTYTSNAAASFNSWSFIKLEFELVNTNNKDT